ncbi:M20/M25/M40 family metallo-hydrolase [Algoriphagus kandeliae]|uniref:M20/M25/M40 family metallo-hydrolase n=1 Tax=Algoriphagus kandeliae TaxID=2562278 RepID=A0A4Y9QYS9_9BACT|nr:M20/M25/M40 family metallo-hydrolase [Algoriphagus kandeliae]TFV97684.1 M20/M25/M40 family metallo-hydrolase [Algoriphagus kandeliae]
MNKRILIGILSIVLVGNTFGQLNKKTIQELSRQELKESLERFSEFLKIPNNGRIPEDIQANLAWSQAYLEELGYSTQVLSSNQIPHLFASKKEDSNKKTVLVYMQIDGQPVDSSAWDQESPYLPVMKHQVNENWEQIPWSNLQGEIDPNWKIFARSASDSKGPAMVFFTVLEILKKEGIEPAVNLKFILDFQEELSSPELAKVIEQHQDLVAADGILIMDGTRHVSNLPNLTFGARGIATVTLKIFGANRDLHSGQYGNFAPNPVFEASRLIASLKDESGRVLIPCFYEGVNLTEKDLLAMKQVPESKDEILMDLGLASSDEVGNSYQEALQYPSLNIRGIQAAWVGEEVRTIIPSEVIVEIDMRTVQETPGERQVSLLKKYIQDQGFYLISTDEPSQEERKKYSKIAAFSYRIGSQPFRAEMDSDFGKWLEKGMQKVFEENYIKTRQTGGSQPMAPFINILGIPAVSVRVPNPDNNIHAPNENIRIGNYIEGIQTVLGIITESF